MGYFKGVWGIPGLATSSRFTSPPCSLLAMEGAGWADPLRRECLGSLQVQGFDLCSVSFYLGSSRLGGGLQPLHLFSGSSDHPDTDREKYHCCDLPYEPCTTGSEEHGKGGTHFGQQSQSSNASSGMPCTRELPECAGKSGLFLAFPLCLQGSSTPPAHPMPLLCCWFTPLLCFSLSSNSASSAYVSVCSF